MKIPSILQMLEAGVHFGHRVSRWHPKMAAYIFGQRNGVHIIDLEKVREQLEQVLPDIKQMGAEGKTVLFISTKPQAREVVRTAAVRAGMPYLVDRWIGGLLTNFTEIKKLIRRYNELTAKKAEGQLEQYTKKEQLEIQRELERMGTYLEGIKTLDKMPDALFLPAMQKEKTAVNEANRTNVPIIGICDTNANPSKAAYIIAGNDDAVKSITLMVNLVADALVEGKQEAHTAEPPVEDEPAVAEPAPEKISIPALSD